MTASVPRGAGDHVEQKDFIESLEIRTGKGYNEWGPDEDAELVRRTEAHYQRSPLEPTSGRTPISTSGSEASSRSRALRRNSVSSPSLANSRLESAQDTIPCERRIIEPWAGEII